MSIRIMSLVWGDHSGSLSPMEKLVLLRMADFAADDGSSVYPSLNRIASDNSMSRRTVIRSIKSLIEKNILIKVEASSPKDYISNVYRIDISILEKLKNLPPDLPLVSQSHPSDRVSPPLVTECHPPSDRVSPNPSYKPSLININKKILSKDSIQKDSRKFYGQSTESVDNSVVRSLTPRMKAENDTSSLFEQWWDVYPKKTGKIAAHLSFRKAIREGVSAEILIQGAMLYARMKEVTGDRKYIKNPATWLNQGCWDDDHSNTKLPFEVFRKLLKAQIEKEGHIGDSAKAQYAYRMEIAKEKGEYAI